MILDFHTHCFPNSIAARAMSTLSAKAGIPHLHDGTITGLDKFERDEGCDSFVVLTIATNPKQTRSVNRFAAEIRDIKRNIYAFGSIHPQNEDYKELLSAAKEMGLDGIKMHPEYQEFNVDDENIFPIYEEIFRQGFPLIFHAGEDKGFFPPWHASPDKLARVAKRYPEAVIIAAHMGGYKMWLDAAEKLSQLSNVYIDISFSAGMMPDEEFQKLFFSWRRDRILFGSDSPWHRASAVIRAVENLCLPVEDKELIYSGNALRLLGLYSDYHGSAVI